MRSLNLPIIHVITHNGPTGHIGVRIILAMDLNPRIQLERARSVESLSYTSIDMGIFARASVTVTSRQVIAAQAPELVYAKRR